jgi:hypothetical protein
VSTQSTQPVLEGAPALAEELLVPCVSTRSSPCEYSEYPMSVLGVPRVSTQSTLRRLRGGEEGYLGHARPGARQHRSGTGPASALALARRWLARLAERPRPCCAAAAHQTAAGVPCLFVCLFARVVACCLRVRSACGSARTQGCSRYAHSSAAGAHGRGGTLSTHTHAAAVL